MIKINSNCVRIKIFPNVVKSNVQSINKLRPINDRNMSNVSSKFTLPGMINIDTEHAINLSFSLAEFHDMLFITSLHVLKGIS